MWKTDKIVPLIGVALVISITLLSTLVLLIPAEKVPSVASESRISDLHGQFTTQRLKVVLSPQPEDDEKTLVRIIRESVFLVNSRATQCMACLAFGDETTLKSTAGLLRGEIDGIIGEIENLNVTSESSLSLSIEYRKNLCEYREISNVFESGIPETGSENDEICTRFIAASNRMIAIYNSIEFDAGALDNLTRESPLIPSIDAKEEDAGDNRGPAEEEIFAIEGAFAMGDTFRYMDSKGYNKISITVPRDTGKFTRAFTYVDKSTKREVTMTAPEGKKYYCFVVICRHDGHLDGKTETITPPKPKSHTLVTSIKTYKPLSIEVLGGSTSIGKFYTGDKIERLQAEGSTLIYEVPEEFTREGSHLTVDLGTRWGKQTWKLWESTTPT